MTKDMFELIRDREKEIRDEERSKIIEELLSLNQDTDVTIGMVVQMIESRRGK